MSPVIRVIRTRSGVLAGALLILCLPAWWLARSAFLATWLAAWCFCLGVVLGGLANVWVHNLTGGAWGEAIRRPLLDLGRFLPWLALFFVPVLAGLADLYPWAAEARSWAGELSAPHFKNAWLQPGFFTVRAVALLSLWNVLAWYSRRPAWERSRGFAAVALVLYGGSIGVAAADWIMSLMPLWYSSSFGLVVGMGQILAGMAFAALVACRRPGAAETGARRDIGTFLFTYVLTWAYLAFTQFLIIWSENLPHEIVWYVARKEAGWLALGVAVALFQFAIPLVLLLFRAVKDSARWLGYVAAGLLAAHLLNLWWLILPSVARPFASWQLLWLLPLSALGLTAVCYRLIPEAESQPRELRHA